MGLRNSMPFAPVRWISLVCAVALMAAPLTAGAVEEPVVSSSDDSNGGNSEVILVGLFVVVVGVLLLLGIQSDWEDRAEMKTTSQWAGIDNPVPTRMPEQPLTRTRPMRIGLHLAF